MKHPLDHFQRLMPEAVRGGDVARLIDGSFLAYNSARLREACQIFTKKYAASQVTVAVSAAGALTPAGLGGSCLVPLMKAGLIDWMVLTGANLYHDIHFALGQRLHIGSHTIDDRELREDGVVRIYDILFKADVLFEADAYSRDFAASLGDRGKIGSAEFHHLLGQKLLGDKPENKDYSVLMTAAELGIPLFTSSPGDSTLGMNMAAVALGGANIDFDVSLDVNLTAAIVHSAKKRAGLSGVLLLGGGSPKNYILQTEPYIQEILMLPDTGHDYFIQFTDARPDTGGLSGATPAEAVSWGKIDPEKLPDTVVCYGDTTVYLPLLTAYALEKGAKREQKRLYDRLGEMLDELREDWLTQQQK
ncbi:MAG: homospermidine biosynthesis protein [Candidatus Latescibacterota bacterium]